MLGTLDSKGKFQIGYLGAKYKKALKVYRDSLIEKRAQFHYLYYNNFKRM